MAIMNRHAMFTACVILVSALAGCNGKPAISTDAELEDPYCDISGYFNFTVRNNETGEGTFKYNWSLNDPSADSPMHNGTGKVTLGGLREKKISISIPDEYDCRYYVMHIRVYCGAEEVANFSGQKSPYDWNYSVLPPVEYGIEPDYVYVAFESWVLRGDSGNIEIWMENITYNPPENPLKMEIGQFYLFLGRKNAERWLASEILNNSDPGKAGFFDADHNGLISDHDHFVLPSNYTNATSTTQVSFDCALPFIQRGWHDDDLVLEDRNAILVKNISIQPEKPTTLDDIEFTLVIQARNQLRMVFIGNYVCSHGGLSGSGKHLELVAEDGQNKTYRTLYDLSTGETETHSGYFYLEVRDDSGNDRLVTYVVRL